MFHIVFVFKRHSASGLSDSMCPVWVETGISNFSKYGHARTAEIVIFCRTACTRGHASNSSAHITGAPSEGECSWRAWSVPDCSILAHPEQRRTRAVLAANPGPGRGHWPRRLLEPGEAHPATSQGSPPQKRSQSGRWCNLLVTWERWPYCSRIGYKGKTPNRDSSGAWLSHAFVTPLYTCSAHQDTLVTGCTTNNTQSKESPGWASPALFQKRKQPLHRSATGKSPLRLSTPPGTQPASSASNRHRDRGRDK